MSDEILWCEKYRPKTVQECILPNELKEQFQTYVNTKEIPNLILSGSAGTGKTSISKALCDEIGLDYILINGSDESGIDTLRTKVKGFASSVSLYGGRKVIIIDEADYLNPNSTQPAFRGVIEEFSTNCSFIFTCNYKNRIIEPLHSRCAVIDFKLKNGDKAKMASAFMKRCQMILDREKIEYDPKVVAEVITKFFPDNRRILNELQRYSVRGRIDSGILAHSSDAKFGDLMAALKAKNYNEARKWVAMNHDNDANVIFRQLYDKLSDVLEPTTIPVAVVILGKYQYQAAFVADPEINLMACVTELMCECSFK